MQIVRLHNDRFRVAVLDIPGPDPDALPDVYIHGLGASAISTFPDIALHPIIRAPRAIMIDLPGFGFSHGPDEWTYAIEDQAALVIDVLDTLRVPRFNLIAHSMGGSISIALTHRWPHRVARLVVAEPNLDPGHGTLSAIIARSTEHDFVERGYTKLVRATERQAMRDEGNASYFLPTLLQASPIAMHRGATSLLAQRAPTFRQQFASAPMPRTYIAGDRSNRVIPESLTSTGVAFRLMMDAGHVMMDDDPFTYIQLLAEALERV